MVNNLDPKATFFLQMGFERVIKQFAAQGYPPPGEYAGFIDCAEAVCEAPPDAFNL